MRVCGFAASAVRSDALTTSSVFSLPLFPCSLFLCFCSQDHGPVVIFSANICFSSALYPGEGGTRSSLLLRHGSRASSPSSATKPSLCSPPVPCWIRSLLFFPFFFTCHFLPLQNICRHVCEYASMIGTQGQTYMSLPLQHTCNILSNILYEAYIHMYVYVCIYI